MGGGVDGIVGGVASIRPRGRIRKIPIDGHVVQVHAITTTLAGVGAMHRDIALLRWIGLLGGLRGNKAEPDHRALLVIASPLLYKCRVEAQVVEERLVGVS